ncbi:GlxA family transcriptional regulator [Ktedonobacter sp. SOSP1-85]|uniref:GlxA family transcriptional regulator n=1 Tax=Ktedonobacter sp. SOSP1-85 TaxID=2778367 RepID=UPI001916C00D|nr:helix-turn-helix domain-containing protein [Ktedonobacter sp. SOSP1-85]
MMHVQNQSPLGSTDNRVRRIVFFVPPHVHLLDLAGPAQVFDTALRAGAPYTLHYCSPQAIQESAQGMVIAHLTPLASITRGDLIIVPGMERESFSLEAALPDQETCDWLRSASQAGAHIASICTGAFTLGEAGLLDGRRCTTHWALVEVLQARFPRARVLENVLFAHDGTITTSAGIASGIDLALAFLEHAQGPMFAAQVARHLVVYMRRNGCEPQRSIYLEYRTHLHAGVHRVQDYLISHVAEHVSLKELATIAKVSSRELNRAFKEATGLTPIQYHQRLRLELAATLLANPTLRVEDVALQCGFEDVRHFRRLWQRRFGLPPSLSRTFPHIA